ncbi:2-phosphosulfolactate phosphatase [Neobacillus terrae]|uniref:2-phosphosulfolactate phosphatase n=1 Tax=Neobacillus terrae TaxID=3034837 RepID=UPI0014092047|nr:2-phosphosulfolactate phosphatase [Neobacillus terrae]NHM33861.1 2-phosphosulfolactate phosphatase [Neobacillus terrae]
MKINIFQGHKHDLPYADVNVVIDVIRAFTVSHYAFLGGVKEILLVPSVPEAIQLKKEHPDYLLAGEVKGLPIPEFDLDNSPKRMACENADGKTIVQKTTNGVEATLNALQADFIFVTGFSNAKNTAEYIRRSLNRDSVVNIIASHPSGDDDLACAEYIQSLLLRDGAVTFTDTVNRIENCDAAQKFYDESQPEFDCEDISFCKKELDSSFVMAVDCLNGLPRIVRVDVNEPFRIKAASQTRKA